MADKKVNAAPIPPKVREDRFVIVPFARCHGFYLWPSRRARSPIRLRSQYRRRNPPRDQHGDGWSATECPGHIAEAGHHQSGKARDRGCGAQSEAGVGGFARWQFVREGFPLDEEGN